MLTAIEVENFKGIGKPIRIELRPLTLLFGPNSAGKSSIFHALQYAEEILERTNLDPTWTSRGGAGVDLGGFRALVHNHDLDRAVRFRFEFNTDSAELPSFAEWWEPELVEFDEGLSAEVKTAWVEWTVRWSQQLSFPFVEEYSVGANGSVIGRLRTRGGATVWLQDVDMAHRLLHHDGRETRLGQAELPLVAQGLESEIPCVTGGVWAMPDWTSPIEFSPASEAPAQGEERMIGHLTDREFYLRISTLFVGLGSLLRDELRLQRHVGPLRALPAREHSRPRLPDETRWASGLAAWDALTSLAGSKTLGKLNDWLRRLGAGYSVHVNEFKAVPLSSRLGAVLSSGEGTLDHIESLNEDFALLPTTRRFHLVDEARQVDVLPSDVGVGVTQLLPILLAAEEIRGERPRLVAIEQPELHVHPAIQVELGDFFAAEASSERILLLETHSEHLILRLLRRIEETSSGDLPPGAPRLTPAQLSVVYIEPVNGEVEARHLRIDGSGEFVDRWPKGFFTERAAELI